MSEKNDKGLKAKLLIDSAEKEGREAAWNHLEHGAPCVAGENPYEGILKLEEAWDSGFSSAENDYWFEKENPDMYYDEDEEYNQDFVEREW